jgi:hypothetical protein
MAVITGNRIRQTRKHRAVLAAVLVAWLSSALQPCLMAMEMSPDPATDSVVSTSHASHVNHGGHSSADGAEAVPTCVHCPPAVDVQSQGVCESTLQADCDSQAVTKHDTRVPKFDPKDSDHSPIWLAPAVFQAADHTGNSVPALQPGKLIGPSGPDLKVFFCVYQI